MGYTVEYKGEKAEIRAQALSDAINYISSGHHAKLIAIAEELEAEGYRVSVRFRSLLLALEFCGVRGLPARMMALELMRD